jgi:hypothetical protein
MLKLGEATWSRALCLLNWYFPCYYSFKLF